MRAKLTVILAAAVTLIAAGTAFSAVDARLTGTFDTDVTILQSSFDPGSEGTTVHRTYKFIPNCNVGVCARVVFVRESGSGEHFRSTLHRTAQGEYEGTESNTGVTCPGHPTQTTNSTIHHHVEIVRKDHGKATKITGRTNFSWECGDTETTKFVGKKV